MTNKKVSMIEAAPLAILSLPLVALALGACGGGATPAPETPAAQAASTAACSLDGEWHASEAQTLFTRVIFTRQGADAQTYRADHDDRVNAVLPVRIENERYVVELRPRGGAAPDTTTGPLNPTMGAPAGEPPSGLGPKPPTGPSSGVFSTSDPYMYNCTLASTCESLACEFDSGAKFTMTRAASTSGT